MSTNGTVARARGEMAERGGETPETLLAKPKTLRNGIVLYGRVASATHEGRWYTVRKKHVGPSRYSYQCTCDGWFLGGVSICRHMAAFKLAEGDTSQRNGARSINNGTPDPGPHPALA